eukprot:jgi/Bigna1/66258/fgenesh1_pg.1_\
MFEYEGRCSQNAKTQTKIVCRTRWIPYKFTIREALRMTIWEPNASRFRCVASFPFQSRNTGMINGQEEGAAVGDGVDPVKRNAESDREDGKSQPEDEKEISIISQGLRFGSETDEAAFTLLASAAAGDILEDESKNGVSVNTNILRSGGVVEEQHQIKNNSKNEDSKAEEGLTIQTVPLGERRGTSSMIELLEDSDEEYHEPKNEVWGVPPWGEPSFTETEELNVSTSVVVENESDIDGGDEINVKESPKVLQEAANNGDSTGGDISLSKNTKMENNVNYEPNEKLQNLAEVVFSLAKKANRRGSGMFAMYYKFSENGKRITLESFKRGLHDLSIHMNDEDIGNIFEQYAVLGVISYASFVRMLSMVQQSYDVEFTDSEKKSETPAEVQEKSKDDRGKIKDNADSYNKNEPKLLEEGESNFHEDIDDEEGEVPFKTDNQLNDGDCDAETDLNASPHTAAMRGSGNLEGAEGNLLPSPLQDKSDVAMLGHPNTLEALSIRAQKDEDNYRDYQSHAAQHGTPRRGGPKSLFSEVNHEDDGDNGTQKDEELYRDYVSYAAQHGTPKARNKRSNNFFEEEGEEINTTGLPPWMDKSYSAEEHGVYGIARHGNSEQDGENPIKISSKEDEQGKSREDGEVKQQKHNETLLITDLLPMKDNDHTLTKKIEFLGKTVFRLGKKMSRRGSGMFAMYYRFSENGKRITKDSFKRGLADISFQMSNSDVDRIFEKYEGDDGGISYATFVRMLSKKSKPSIKFKKQREKSQPPEFTTPEPILPLRVTDEKQQETDITMDEGQDIIMAPSSRAVDQETDGTMNEKPRLDPLSGVLSQGLRYGYETDDSAFSAREEDDAKSYQYRDHASHIAHLGTPKGKPRSASMAELFDASNDNVEQQEGQELWGFPPWGSPSHVEVENISKQNPSQKPQQAETKKIEDEDDDIDWKSKPYIKTIETKGSATDELKEKLLVVCDLTEPSKNASGLPKRLELLAKTIFRAGKRMARRGSGMIAMFDKFRQNGKKITKVSFKNGLREVNFQMTEKDIHLIFEQYASDDGISYASFVRMLSRKSRNSLKMRKVSNSQKFEPGEDIAATSSPHKRLLTEERETKESNPESLESYVSLSNLLGESDATGDGMSKEAETDTYKVNTLDTVTSLQESHSFQTEPENVSERESNLAQFGGSSEAMNRLHARTPSMMELLEENEGEAEETQGGLWGLAPWGEPSYVQSEQNQTPQDEPDSATDSKEEDIDVTVVMNKVNSGQEHSKIMKKYDSVIISNDDLLSRKNPIILSKKLELLGKTVFSLGKKNARRGSGIFAMYYVFSKNGKLITKESFKKGLEEVSFPMSDTEVDEVFNQYAMENGISYSTFVRMLSKKTRKSLSSKSRGSKKFVESANPNVAIDGNGEVKVPDSSLDGDIKKILPRQRGSISFEATAFANPDRETEDIGKVLDMFGKTVSRIGAKRNRRGSGFYMMFEVFSNGSKWITPESFKEGLKSCRIQMRDSTVEKIFRIYAPASCNRIKFSNFVRLITLRGLNQEKKRNRSGVSTTGEARIETKELESKKAMTDDEKVRSTESNNDEKDSVTYRDTSSASTNIQSKTTDSTGAAPITSPGKIRDDTKLKGSYMVDIMVPNSTKRKSILHKRIEMLSKTIFRLGQKNARRGSGMFEMYSRFSEPGKKVTRESLQKGLKSINFRLSYEDIEEIFDRYAAEDGISYSAFVRMLSRPISGGGLAPRKSSEQLLPGPQLLPPTPISTPAKGTSVPATPAPTPTKSVKAERKVARRSIVFSPTAFDSDKHTNDGKVDSENFHRSLQLFGKMVYLYGSKRQRRGSGLYNMFEIFSDGCKYITHESFIKGLKSCKFQMKEIDVQLIFENYGNGAGQIKYSAFVRMLSNSKLNRKNSKVADSKTTSLGFDKSFENRTDKWVLVAKSTKRGIEEEGPSSSNLKHIADDEQLDTINSEEKGQKIDEYVKDSSDDHNHPPPEQTKKLADFGQNKSSPAQPRKSDTDAINLKNQEHSAISSNHAADSKTGKDHEMRLESDKETNTHLEAGKRQNEVSIDNNIEPLDEDSYEKSTAVMNDPPHEEVKDLNEMQGTPPSQSFLCVNTMSPAWKGVTKSFNFTPLILTSINVILEVSDVEDGSYHATVPQNECSESGKSNIPIEAPANVEQPSEDVEENYNSNCKGMDKFEQDTGKPYVTRQSTAFSIEERQSQASFTSAICELFAPETQNQHAVLGSIFDEMGHQVHNDRDDDNKDKTYQSHLVNESEDNTDEVTVVKHQNSHKDTSPLQPHSGQSRLNQQSITSRKSPTVSIQEALPPSGKSQIVTTNEPQHIEVKTYNDPRASSSNAALGSAKKIVLASGSRLNVSTVRFLLQLSKETFMTTLMRNYQEALGKSSDEENKKLFLGGEMTRSLHSVNDSRMSQSQSQSQVEVMLQSTGGQGYMVPTMVMSLDDHENTIEPATEKERPLPKKKNWLAVS